MKLELPWPPSVNHYWGQRVSRGRKPFVMMYLTARAKKYRSAVLDVVARTDCWARFCGRIRVRISVHPPNRRKFDLDNLCKSLLDAITHSELWDDDEQIDDLHLMRGEIVPDGCVIVEVTELK